MTSPAVDLVALRGRSGCWLMQVLWLERMELAAAW
jgi:hypothetical protein